jgi:hypothetical protein
VLDRAVRSALHGVIMIDIGDPKRVDDTAVV